MDDSTPVEPRTKEPFEMDDQSFVSSDTYQVEFDTGSQFESPGRSSSGRWHTTNSSNTMELEHHLSASSVSRDAQASSVSNKPYDESGRTISMFTQSEGQSYQSSGRIPTSDRGHDSYEEMKPIALLPKYSPSHIFGDDGNYSNSEGRYGSSETSHPNNMNSAHSLDPSLMDPRAIGSSEVPNGYREPQDPANFMPAANTDQRRSDIWPNNPSDQRRDSRERLDPGHLMSTPGLERRGRSPSPGPKISAETKARWAMLKQLAGVSQPHDVEEEDRNARLDEETLTMEVDSRIRENASGASVRDPSTIGDRSDDGSIERYLQKVQRDPHIDDRGLREGLSRMHSYKGLSDQQDQYLPQDNSFETNVHSGHPRISEDTRISGVGSDMRRGEHDAKNILHRAEGRAGQALMGGEAGLKRDEHDTGAITDRAGHRGEAELRSASYDARDNLHKDRQGFGRDVRRDTSMADAEIQKLSGLAATEFRRGEHGLEAGFQGAARTAESLLPLTNFRQDLRKGERDLMGDVHKAENSISQTGLGQEVRRGEHNLMEEAHKLEQELPHIGLRQEIRKGEANLMGDVHKVENEMANTELGQEVRKNEHSLMGDVHKFEHEFPHTALGQEIREGEAKVMGDIHKVENEIANTRLGQEIRRGEHHLLDGFDELEHELPHLGLDQDLRKGEHELKQGLQEADDNQRRGKQALGRGAEAAGRSVAHGAEHIGRLAVEGAAMAGGLGMMALGPNGQRVSSTTQKPGPNLPGASGPHPAPNVRRPNQPPTNNQNRPSIVEPPQYPPTPQMSQMLQSGHDRGPPGSQQPRLSPSPSPARALSPGLAMNKSPPGRMPSPSSRNNQSSQTPIRKPVLPPRPQGSPQQRPPITVPPHPQHPQGAPQYPSQAQHPQAQHPQGSYQHPSQAQHPQGASQQLHQAQHPQGAPQHPQGAPQHPPQSQHPQGVQPHPSQHPQPPHPQGVPQHPQTTIPQHPPPQHPAGASQHPPNVIPQNPQLPHAPQGAPQQRQPLNSMPQHPPPSQPQEVPKQRPQSPMPSRTQLPQGASQQRSQGPVPPHTQPPHNPNPNTKGPPKTQPPHTQGPLQQRSQGPMPPYSQAPNPQRAAQIPHPQPQPQPQQALGTPQPELPNDRRDGTAQRPEAMSSTSVQQGRQAIPGAAAGPHPARSQPFPNKGPTSEGKTDEEPRASIMQERKRKAAEARRRLAERQEQQSGNDCKHEDHEAEYCPHQTECHSTTERAEEPRAISGPQSMLNMFKARADAAIEASGDRPSFTDHLLIEMIQLLCKMGQDAMPEIERRLAQNARHVGS
ncbi:hypothetical protein IMSHALPRED_005374 [Imshaugia aleurites]|uniref:Uncharacterized protein n=1 Tax=Imshaugia aleurites TaxID=172621 RepID=A0A8H3EK60_9LECA|nr:hypothetical protein IMSHALPRED_005374 [Imshaugia aleurites]